MYNKVWNAIEGKSWYDAKRKARSLFRKAARADEEHRIDLLMQTGLALTDYHGELYGRGLCDTESVYEFLNL